MNVRSTALTALVLALSLALAAPPADAGYGYDGKRDYGGVTVRGPRGTDITIGSDGKIKGLSVGGYDLADLLGKGGSAADNINELLDQLQTVPGRLREQEKTVLDALAEAEEKAREAVGDDPSRLRQVGRAAYTRALRDLKPVGRAWAKLEALLIALCEAKGLEKGPKNRLMLLGMEITGAIRIHGEHRAAVYEKMGAESQALRIYKEIYAGLSDKEKEAEANQALKERIETLTEKLHPGRRPRTTEKSEPEKDTPDAKR